MPVNPQERKRLLAHKAKEELEARGYGLVKKQSGGYILIDGETEKPLGEFKTIEQLGAVLGLWGFPLPDPDHPGKDLITGKRTPNEEAIMEKIKKAPKPPKPPKVSAPKNKKW